jgi:hypothetical protein
MRMRMKGGEERGGRGRRRGRRRGEGGEILKLQRLRETACVHVMCGSRQYVHVIPHISYHPMNARLHVYFKCIKEILLLYTKSFEMIQA